MRKPAQGHSPPRGQTVVAILVVLVILAALVAVWFFARPSRKAGKTSPEGLPRASLERAHEVECRNNLQQVRAALQMAQAEGNNPPDLASLNLAESLLRCPVGGEPYRYDPQTGQVNCSHPGHEKF